MISYRFRRRAFISGVSGAIGLKIMLRNLEGSAQGIGSPPRLLVTHWPLGIVAGAGDAFWRPTSGSVGGSLALKPFADAGLGPDMTVVRGISTNHLQLNGSGGHEGGTVVLMTGRAVAGTRSNRAEGDDAIASPGGSYDQILLEKVPALQRPGQGYANSIADSRTDCGEISTKCLSYSTRTQDATLYAGGTRLESTPLMPVLSPLDQYTRLFGGMAPGTPGTGGSAGGAGGQGGSAPPRVADAILKKLVGRRSVLDFAREELNQLKRLAPSEARNKLTIHTDAVVAAEASISNAINSAYPNTGGGAGAGGSPTGTGGGGAGGSGGGAGPDGVCATRPPAPSSLMGQPDWFTGFYGNYDDPTRGATDDAPVHAQVGKAHLDVLKAAFVCDLIRVGTYQWAPGPNHVGFALYPGATKPYSHHPTSHRVFPNEPSTVAELSGDQAFLLAVQMWYFARHAENFATWKSTIDGYGNGLLDFTCVPFLTEVDKNNHSRSNMAAMIIGGRRLGFLHDRYVAQSIPSNRLWGTIAQAFGHTSTTDPSFGEPVPGFWTQPL